MLICPESRTIERLLFVSPHVLFDYGLTANANQTLSSYVSPEPMHQGPSTSWHYPVEPVVTHQTLKATLHDLNANPNTDLFQTYTGRIGNGRVEIPAGIIVPEVLGYLEGSGRTVFEYVFEEPVPLGQKRWLRLHIKPPRLNAPGEVQLWKESCQCSPKAEYYQLLDLLGADTILASFKDQLLTLAEPFRLPEPLNRQVTEPIRNASNLLLSHVFEQGFDKQGTYTRIEDQRILLLPRDCRINIRHTEGSVRFLGYPRLAIDGKLSNGFCWAAGLRAFAEHDPIEVAQRITRYVRGYAPTKASGKPKAYLALATGVDYQLGCLVIDALEEVGVLQSSDDTFYSGDKDLPQNEMERWSLLVDLSYRIGCKFSLTKGHFRILYEAEWRH